MFIENTLKSLKNIGDRIKTSIRKEDDRELVSCYLSVVPEPPVSEEEKKTEEEKVRDSFRRLIQVDTLCIEVAPELISFIDPNCGAKLLDLTTSIRRHIALEMGLLLPGVRFKDNNNLKSNSYIIKIRDIVIAKGEVIPDRYLAIGPEKNLVTLEGPRVLEPTYGMPAVWITASQRGEAERAGTMIFDPVSVISTQVTEAIRKYAFEMLDYHIVLKIIEDVRTYNHLLVEEIYPKFFTLQEIYEVLYNLIREGISVRDMVTIMETMAYYAPVVKDTDSLAEYVRQSLCHVICRVYKDDNNTITVITVEEKLEKILLSLKEKKHGDKFKIRSVREEALIDCLEEQIKSINTVSPVPVIVCSSQVRLILRRLIEKSFPELAVLSYDEIHGGIKLNTIAALTLSDEIADRYNNREKLLLSYVEKFQKDSHPSIRCTAIKMIDSIMDKYNPELLLDYLNRGLTDDDRDVRLESAETIKKIFENRTETEHVKDLNKIFSFCRKPYRKQNEEACEKVEVNNPQGFSMEVDLLAVEIGRGLISLVDKNQGGKLFDRVSLIKKKLTADIGFIIPPIRYRDNLQLKPNEYLIKVRDIEVAKGEVILNKFMVTGTESNLKTLKGQECFAPYSGKPAMWITPALREEAEKSGCSVFNSPDVMALHLEKIIVKYACDLLDYNEVADLMEHLKKDDAILVKETYPKIFRIIEIHRILKNLLQEHVSIKDLSLIMRTLREYVPVTGDIELLTEYVRQSLSRVICRPFQDEEGTIQVVTIDGELERILAGSLKGNLPAIDNETGEFILSSVKEHSDAFDGRNRLPMILCSSCIRPAFRKFIERSFPELSVLSYEEIPPEIKVDKKAVISLPVHILERYGRKDRLIFSYIEKFQKDLEPSIRTMAVKMILSLSERYDTDKLLPYLNTGLKDEDLSVRNEYAGVVKELLG